MTSTTEISAEFPFESRYVEVEGCRMHYVDEGEGDPVLFLHGNPTSSYLWRNVIPHMTAFARAIAPDLAGMGRSDKPDIPYRFFDHSRYVEGFIAALGLENVSLVIHDWGSALGFHYARRHEDNLRGIAFMEAILRPVRWADFPKDLKLGFKLFRTPGVVWAMISAGNVFVDKILPQAIVRRLSSEEMARYREPSPPSPAGARCASGRGRSRSTAIPPTSTRRSPPTAPGCRRPICPSCCATPGPAF